jgi:hypothetical protein
MPQSKVFEKGTSEQRNKNAEVRTVYSETQHTGRVRGKRNMRSRT